jgi:hypothetical protein
MKQTEFKQCFLVFNDQFPHGKIMHKQYVDNYDPKDYMTVIEINSAEELLHIGQAVNDMQRIFQLEDLNKFEQ